MQLRTLSVALFATLGLACSSSGTSNTGGDACQVGCDKVAALKCTGDKPASCLTECQATVAQANKIGCGAQANAYLDCVVHLAFACDKNGYANPVDESPCKAKDDALSACAKEDAAPPPPLDAASGG